MEKRSKDYVVVVGGVNMDIVGKSTAALIPQDSNPGTVRMSLGGVGKNIAHNLALLGEDVKMLTALGDDANAQLVQKECRRAGIDLQYAKHVPGGATSVYLAIDGPEGDMALALCDQELALEITPAYLSGHLELLNGASAVALETNLTREALTYLAQNCTAPLFADPVSVTKAEKLRGLLGSLYALKPNRIEAQLLSGVEITDGKSLGAAADKLLQAGMERVFISLGGEGLYCAGRSERVQVPCCPTSLKNATGGGDALMAAIIHCQIRQLGLYETARFALAASAIAVECEETVNPAMSAEAVLARAKLS